MWNYAQQKKQPTENKQTWVEVKFPAVFFLGCSCCERLRFALASFFVCCGRSGGKDIDTAATAEQATYKD